MSIPPGRRVSCTRRIFASLALVVVLLSQPALLLAATPTPAPTPQNATPAEDAEPAAVSDEPSEALAEEAPETSAAESLAVEAAEPKVETEPEAVSEPAVAKEPGPGKSTGGRTTAWGARAVPKAEESVESPSEADEQAAPEGGDQKPTQVERAKLAKQVTTTIAVEAKSEAVDGKKEPAESAPEKAQPKPTTESAQAMTTPERARAEPTGEKAQAESATDKAQTATAAEKAAEKTEAESVAERAAAEKVIAEGEPRVVSEVAAKPETSAAEARPEPAATAEAAAPEPKPAGEPIAEAPEPGEPAPEGVTAAVGGEPEPTVEEPLAEEPAPVVEEPEPVAEAPVVEQVVEPAPVATRPIRPVVADWAPAQRTADGLSAHVMTYAGLILGAAEEIGVDPALIAALMEVEGSGPNAVSHAGAMGLMQLMPDKLQAGDDPFDPGTNILRAAQLLRRLTAAYRGDLISVSAAYFGAIDHQGQVTDSSDGISNGFEYVSRFAAAYQRWALAFNQPHQVLAIRPTVKQRASLSGTAVEVEPLAAFVFTSPERDRWYLFVEKAQPALPPTAS